MCEVVARQVIRHMSSLKMQMAFFEALSGSLVRVRDLHVSKLTGSFIKIEIISAVLSRDNIHDPFASPTGDAQDSDEEGGGGGGSALNISDIRVRACTSLLCQNSQNLPSQNSGACDATRTPVWNSTMYYDICDSPEVEAMIERGERASGNRSLVDLSQLPGIVVSIKLSQVRGGKGIATIADAIIPYPLYFDVQGEERVYELQPVRGK